jgi:hypothetical protein
MNTSKKVVHCYVWAGFVGRNSVCSATELLDSVQGYFKVLDCLNTVRAVEVSGLENSILGQVVEQP